MSLRRPYKIEAFGRDFTFRSMAITGELNLLFDYLTLERISATVKAIDVKRGDLIHITDFEGRTVYDGIVNLTETEKDTMTINIDPLLSLLNVPAVFSSKDQYIEDWIAGMISAKYETNTHDPIQDISCSVTAETQTEGIIQTEDLPINLWDVCVAAFQQYGITVSAELDLANKQIDFTVGTISGSRIVEADLDNVLDKNIVLDDSTEANLATFLLQDLSARYSAWIGTSDNSLQLVSGDPAQTNRRTPVVEQIEIVDSLDPTELLPKAQEILLPSQYKNLIELAYDIDDALVNPADLIIGEPVTVVHDGSTYPSILSGYEQSDGMMRLIFGVVRIELTKKLIIERRSSR